jgi:hypothetical protein
MGRTRFKVGILDMPNSNASLTPPNPQFPSSASFDPPVILRLSIDVMTDCIWHYTAADV